MDLAFVNEDAWKNAEDRVARLTSTPLLPMDEFEGAILRRDVANSCFSLEDVRLLAETQADLLIRFGCTWILHNRGIDYAEDWDLEEGDQQSSAKWNPSESTFVRGFLVTSGVLLLYAAHAPGQLQSYLAARRIPKAKRVSEDVIRLYQMLRDGPAY